MCQRLYPFYLRCRRFKVISVYSTILPMFFLISPAQADLFFPPALLGGGNNVVADLSHFEKQGAQLPGLYTVDISLNGEPVFRQSLRFVLAAESAHSKKNFKADEQIDDRTGLKACLTQKELKAFRVNMSAFKTELSSDNDSCIIIDTYIPGAHTFFDFQKMRLNVSIPQIALISQARGYISSEMWDEGINAALLNYSFSGNESRMLTGDSRNNSLNLESGLNIGPWRFRDRRNWTHQSSRYTSYQRWQHGTTTLSRAIIPWRSELTLGDATSGGDVFDSFGFRGARLASNEAMLPDSLRGYAPVIRGSAGSNATVSISQNGYEIYRTNVAPGEFAINDLYPMYASGDLVVKVQEAGGHIETFIVPYSSVPVLLREGMTKYDITLGKYRTTGSNFENSTIVQGTLVHGLSNGLTVYGGIQYANEYFSSALGAGLNLGSFGAVSADITHADSTLSDGSQHKGQSMRLMYSRSLNSLGTTFQLAGYRYSTSGFHTLSETLLKRDLGWKDEWDEVPDAASRKIYYSNLYDNKRQRLQANISQRLGDLGALYLTGSWQSYWNQKGTSESLRAGFSSSLGVATYNVSVSHDRTVGYAHTDRSINFSISLPLGQWLPETSSQTYATFNSYRDGSNDIDYQSGLSGSFLKANNLNWNITHGRRNSSSVRLDYQGSYANTNVGYNHSDKYQQLNYGVSGGMIIHRDGLTLGQPLGDTNILIAAPGASGVALENGTGIHTDWRGYTIRPSVSSYRDNRVVLDTSTLDDQTEIDDAVARVVPTKGAIVRADFKTRSGIRALFTLSHNGNPLPFGALVSNADNSSIVGDDGQVYLTGLAPEGTVNARWGEGADKQCIVRYQIPQAEKNKSIAQIKAICK